ncbi:RNA polymerase sigma factor, partial [Sporofaciens musculi]|uniref:RNA polymerase sigma factor n=1 Tax=Sporofaciens musculi TaxID=2681861 RepID=UPI00259C70B8
ITRILINHCKDLLKQQRRDTVSDQLPDKADVPRDDREFYRLIGELNEDYRTIFLLYYGEGFHTREIAQILEVNENTVKSKLRRGREKLKQVLCY